jgi:hypothetical protein
MKHPQYYLRDVIAEDGDHGSVRFRNDYSGRCMFGKTCVGITGTMRDCQEVLSEALTRAGIDSQTVQLGSSREETNRFYRQLVKTLTDFRTDSMGMGSILYWPELPPIPEEL